MPAARWHPAARAMTGAALAGSVAAGPHAQTDAQAGAPTSAQLHAYAIDPTHTFASVEVDTGLTTLRLRFDRKSGTIAFDRAGRTGAVAFKVETASVSSGLPALDDHLRSAALFDATRFPQATFTSESFAFEGDRVTEVAGTLTLRDQLQPLTVKALRFGCYVNPLFLREVCGGDFEAWIEPGRWGLSLSGDSALPGTVPRVRLLVQVEAIRQ